MNDQSKEERIKFAQERYLRAMHAMQTGVEFQEDKTELEPKHLRVGVNSAMVGQGALVQLLIKQGLIDEVAFYEKMADLMEADAESYGKRISEERGQNIKLA